MGYNCHFEVQVASANIGASMYNNIPWRISTWTRLRKVDDAAAVLNRRGRRRQRRLGQQRRRNLRRKGLGNGEHRRMHRP